MKSFQFTPILALILTAFSCDTEDARTPLGITISAPDFETTIEENPVEGTSLGILTANASDDSIIQFGNIIEEDSEDSKFESETPIGALDINDVTGEITVKDASLFDYDSNTEINATVNAISGSLEEAININIFLTEILDIESDINALIDLYNANFTADVDDLDSDDDTEELTIPPALDWNITDDEDIEITEAEISTWEGVILTNGRVTSLNVSNKGLTEIPDSLAKLDQLTFLDISSDDEDNQITDLSDAICEAFNSIETFITDATCEVEDSTETD